MELRILETEKHSIWFHTYCVIIRTNNLFFSLGLVFKIKGKLPTVKSGHDENGSQYKAFHSQMIQLVLKQPSPSAGAPSLLPWLMVSSPL